MATTTERGYGWQHQQLRAALLPIALANGWPCTRCGKRLRPGQDIELDHHDHDRGRYRGFAHARCNRKAGGRKGNRARWRKRVSRKPISSRRW